MSQKLNILMLTEDFLPIYGGISSVVEQSANALSKHANVTIGTVNVKDKKTKKYYVDKPSAYSVIRGKGWHNPVTTNMASLWRFDRKFRKAIESKKYDIIHCHFPLSLYNYALKLGKKYKIPVVITAHSFYKIDVRNTVKCELLANIIVRIIVKRLNKANKIWCVTNFCKNYLLNYGLRKDAVIVNNSVDMCNFLETNNSNLKNDNTFSNSTFTIINVGRLVAMKNGILLIEALNKLKKLNLDINLVFIGTGPEEHNLKKAVSKYNLQDKVAFVGKLDKGELVNYYSNCDLIGFTSVGDSAGLIQVEGAFYNKPTLAIKNNAISEKMTHLKNGILIENTAEDCAEKILYCYQNREQLKQIGENARKTLYRTYLDEDIIQELLSNYSQIITNFKKD